MSEPVDVNVGDTVMVAEHRSVYEATVTKVGRVWVTVGEGLRERRFRLDTQSDPNAVGYGIHFYTLTQWAEKQRRDDALTFLRDQGVDLRYDSPWRSREVELANILRNAT